MPDPDDDLTALRRDIDRIDLTMHEALMERGAVIDRLIAIKGRQGGGSAFRPGREAAMMRALAERHEGLLPLDTVEGVWRIIISTFTYVQAPYRVHADVAAGDAAMRDSVRFHFGFTVPFMTHFGPAGVIDAVATSENDLGMVMLDGGAAAGAWWTALAEPQAPKIIARLPFVERPDHPAGAPAFVLSKPLAEAAARDVVLRAVSIDRWREAISGALGDLGAEKIAAAADGMGLSLLVAAPGEASDARIAQAFAQAGAGDLRMHEIGGHAARFSARAAQRRAA